MSHGSSSSVYKMYIQSLEITWEEGDKEKEKGGGYLSVDLNSVKWRAAVHGIAKSQTQLSDRTTTE